MQIYETIYLFIQFHYYKQNWKNLLHRISIVIDIVFDTLGCMEDFSYTDNLVMNWSMKFYLFL